MQDARSINSRIFIMESMKKKGFTLVEIMIVVSILALLSAIIIPSMVAMRRTANEAAAKSNIRILATSAETLMASRGHYPTNIDEFEEFLAPLRNYCADLDGGPSDVRVTRIPAFPTLRGTSLKLSPLILE